jgi:transposase-like protein
LWAVPETTAPDRQEIVRLVLEQVTVDVQGDSEQVEVTLHWAGGVQSQHQINRPVARYEQLSTYPTLLARIDQLRHDGMSFEHIAEHLNREGFYPPKRADRFNGGMIARLLSRQGLHGPRPRAMVEAAVLEPHEYWLSDLARELNLPRITLYKWQRLGWVHSRKVVEALGRLALWADNDELERLRQLRLYKRQWPNPHYPATLSTPKTREQGENR